jgi:hypothetical protein
MPPSVSRLHVYKPNWNRRVDVTEAILDVVETHIDHKWVAFAGW